MKTSAVCAASKPEIPISAPTASAGSRKESWRREGLSSAFIAAVEAAQDKYRKLYYYSPRLTLTFF